MNIKLLPKNPVDQEIVQRLEEALAQAREGTLKDFAAVYTDKQGTTYSVLKGANIQFAAYASVLLHNRVTR